ncbi:hypothetical protein N0V88_002242 [Collariella sp. IMI 366227]|nr:hypothetical protein N0V88_002242 [Collariella sp. IMI 366227]
MNFPPPPPWHPHAGPLIVPASFHEVRAVDSASEEVESESDSDADFDYDSGSEDSDGEAMSSSAGSERRHEIREKMEVKQRRIWQLRQAMVKKRKQLRELRHQKDDTDNSLMQILRPHLTSKSRVAMIPMDILGDRLRDMQSIRDEYYAAESAYELLETELDTEELALEMLELDFTRMPREQAPLPPQFSIPPPPPTMTVPGIIEDKSRVLSSDEEESAPPSPVSLLGISGDLPEDIHPLYQELLEVAGDRQLAEEYAEDIEMHREKILYDLEIELHRKRVREHQGNQISEQDLQSLRTSLADVPPSAADFEARFGITITEDDLEVLRDYESASTHAKQSLSTATQTLSHLRSLCLKRGLMRKNTSYHEELAIFSSSRIDDPSSALRRAECLKELGIDNLMAKAENTPDYINRWLIHRLRTSPMEVELLLAMCEGNFGW